MDVQQADGFYTVRGTRCIKPRIVGARDDNGIRVRQLEGKWLSWKRLPAHDLDLEIDWSWKGGTYRGRLVVIYRKGSRNRKTFVYLHSNLSSAEFSIQEIGQLYRLRWQVELLFKEYKSHASLPRFDTALAPIAAGLIWARLAVATLKRSIAHAAERVLRVTMSTLRVAASARHFLDDLPRGLLRGFRSLVGALRRAFLFLGNDLRRAHPKRDREKGRLLLGLRHAAAA